MKNQRKYLANKQYGGTIRLGAWPCRINKDTVLEKAYKKYGGDITSPWYTKNPAKDFKIEAKLARVVFERHRHRYEFNNAFTIKFEENGFIISGSSPDGLLVEAVELANHPFFVGTQYHPEYESRPLTPHPIFCAFIEAAKKSR